MQIYYKNHIHKVLLFSILILIAGLPINETHKFIILIFILPIIFFSKINSINRKGISLIIIILFVIYKIFIPQLHIHEGHNIILHTDETDSFYKENLPDEIYEYVRKEFKINSLKFKCDDIGKCWKSFKPNDNSIYAKSRDWTFQKPIYSRVVNDINFFDLTSAKISIINDQSLNYYSINNSNDYLKRDNFPFFVMYKIPSNLINSSICWKGNIFWQNEKFYEKLNNNSKECKQITNKDLNKKIFAVSISENISVILKKSNYLKFIEIFDKIVVLLTVLILLILNLKFNYKVYAFSISYVGSYILLLFYINNQLIYGFDIFPGGMDGMVYLSFGNIIFDHFINLNFYEAWKGVESVFYYPSSLRYFWAISKLFFGESFFGFLLIPFLYSATIFYILKYIVGVKFALIVTFLNFYTNFFDGYALPNMKLINHINVGHAEPLAILFFLFSLFLLIYLTSSKIYNKSIFYNFFLGFLIFLSISLRPNFLPTCLILLFFYITYDLIKKNNFNYYTLFSLLGFSMFFLIPFHNYYYGNELVLLSSGSIHNTGVPLRIYIDFLNDLLSFEFNENFFIILSQIKKWIKPYEVHYILSIFIILTVMITKSNYLIKIICTLALSQHCVLLIYEPQDRYSYLAWILTILVVIYFFKFYIFDKIYSKMLRKPINNERIRN